MKTILCYGDSNTWGYDPASGKRLDIGSRWPGVLRRELGGGYHVIEEGLPGRTTVWDDPIEQHKNGRTYLLPCIYSHMADLVIILLGTNDLKHRFSLTAFDIAQGAKLLASLVMKSDSGPGWSRPQALLIAPPPVTRLSYFEDMFRGAREKSQELAKQFAAAARECGCHFLDAGTLVTSSNLDGIHFEKSQHEILGTAVAEKVREILPSEVG
jgi:lysophospholipase L1-like esterase